MSLRICTVLVGLALLLAGCGGDDDGGGTTSAAGTQSGGATQNASAQGKQVFTQDCGGCHVLGDAGTNGSVGPNLDDLQPQTADVKQQVENGGGGMPAFKGQLSAAEIDAVSSYVASVAGQG